MAKKNPTIQAGLPPVAKKGQLVTLDFEMFDMTKLHRPTGSFAMLSVKLQDDPTVYQLYDEKDLRRLVKVIDKGTWVFHNALYDLRQFRRYADVKPRFIWDTMLLEQSMTGGLYQNYGLADLSRRWLGETMEKETREEFYHKRDITPDMKKYAALDVIKTEAVLLRQLEAWEHDSGMRAYKEADEPMIFPLLDIQGFRVDVGGWEKMVKEFERCGQELEEELGFNVYSKAQVIANVQRRARIKLLNTQAKTLAQYADNPMIQQILEARMYRKAASTYGMKWLEENVEPDGKVYSDYRITGALTGRMSSADPNMQNIPARKLPQYRERFIASPGNIIGVWDVSQQEPSITAYHSQDKKLLETLRAGTSTHLAVAREIYDNPNLDKHKDEEQYRVGKAINLGLSYGLTAYGLAERTNMDVPQAEAMIRKYFQKFSGVHAYIQQNRSHAAKHGFVTTALGRRSYVNLYDRKWENNAINSPIQGGAVDFTKTWGRKTWEKTLAAGLPPTTVGYVHDEVVFDQPKDVAREMKPIIQEAFDETAETLYKNIPFAVEYEYGSTWAAKALGSDVGLDEEGEE